MGSIQFLCPLKRKKVLNRGATRGGAEGGVPLLHFTLKDMSLNRGATHFTLEIRSCIISSFL